MTLPVQGMTYPNFTGTGSFSLGLFHTSPWGTGIDFVGCGSHLFITGVLVNSGTELFVPFDQVAREVTVTNESFLGGHGERTGTLEVAPCANTPTGFLNVTSSNVIAGQHFVPLVPTTAPFQSITFRVPLAGIYLNSSGSAGSQSFARVVAHLTPISTGSFYSGSLAATQTSPYDSGLVRLSNVPVLSGSGMTK